MTALKSRWLTWEPSNTVAEQTSDANEVGEQDQYPYSRPQPLENGTDKTDKSPSVSFVSAVPRYAQPDSSEQTTVGNSAMSPVPLHEAYSVPEADAWLADPWYALRGRQNANTSRPPSDEADWRDLFDERAGVHEHDGELSRADAEAAAFEYCVVSWLVSNPPDPSDPCQCAFCGVALLETGVDYSPFLARDGHVWLHDDCHAPWYTARRVEAGRALKAMGIQVGPSARRT